MPFWEVLESCFYLFFGRKDKIEFVDKSANKTREAKEDTTLISLAIVPVIEMNMLVRLLERLMMYNTIWVFHA